MTNAFAPLRLHLFAAAMATTLAVHAQDDKAAAPPAGPRLQKVEIKGSADSYDARRDDTATKIVVNHEEIVKYGDTNVLDVLKRLPGITVSGAAGRNGGEVRMRGLGAGYTQVLVNGERAPAGFSMDSLAPESIEKIEILRAASAEYSTQSVAGTINIVLKKAIRNAQREWKASAGTGKINNNVGVTMQLSDRLDKLSWSLSGSAFASRFKRDSPAVEETRDPDGALLTQRNTANRSKARYLALNLGPRLNWTFDNGDMLTWQSFLNISRLHQGVRIDIDTPVGEAPPFAHANEELVNNNDTLRSDLSLARKLDTGAKLDLKLGAAFGEVHNNWDRLGEHARNRFVLDTGTYSHETDQAYSSTGKYSTPLVEGHALAFGWDAGLNYRQDDRRQRDVLAAGPIAPERYESKVARLAAFSQDEWNITPQWSLYLGARWEGVQTRTTGTGFDESTSRSSVFSPLVHTLYKLHGTKGDQLRLALTRTYKAPSTYTLMPRRFRSDNNGPTEPDSRGNPDLKPELATGLDAAFEHYWAQGAMVSASISMRRIAGYTNTTVTQGADGRWVSMAVNDGNATTRGLELETKFPLKSLMDNAPALDVRASLSRNWSRVDSVPGPGNRLDQQTPFSASTGLDYKAGALSVGGSYTFRTGGPVRLSVEQTRYQSVRRDLEMYGLWKFDARNQLRIVFGNMLAQPWISESRYAGKDQSTWRRQVYPNSMNVRATMEMKF